MKRRNVLVSLSGLALNTGCVTRDTDENERLTPGNSANELEYDILNLDTGSSPTPDIIEDRTPNENGDYVTIIHDKKDAERIAPKRNGQKEAAEIFISSTDFSRQSIVIVQYHVTATNCLGIGVNSAVLDEDTIFFESNLTTVREICTDSEGTITALVRVTLREYTPPTFVVISFDSREIRGEMRSSTLDTPS